MILQIIIIAVLSVLITIFSIDIAHVFKWLFNLNTHVTHWLGLIFSNSAIGQLIQATLALLIIPIVGGALIGVIAKLLKRRVFPAALIATWLIWMALVVVICLKAH